MTADTEIVTRISEFKNDLASLHSQSIVRKHVASGGCYISDRNEYYALREAVAAHFSIHPNDVMVVGSGKLGFSISRTKHYRPFAATSDIDVAVVSSSLFDVVWAEVFDYLQDLVSTTRALSSRTIYACRYSYPL